MEEKLRELLDKRPSVLANSSFVLIVWIASWLIGVALLIIGSSFLIHNLSYGNFLSDFEIIKEFEPTAMNLIGYTAVAVGILLLFVVRLCKMLIRRNLFLLELDEWRSEWEKKVNVNQSDV